MLNNSNAVNNSNEFNNSNDKNEKVVYQYLIVDYLQLENSWSNFLRRVAWRKKGS